MLYRHFPKITNTKLSILAADLSKMEYPVSNTEAPESSASDSSKALLEAIANTGTNLYRVGNDPQRIKYLHEMQALAGFSEEPWRILEVPAHTSGESLRSFLKQSEAQGRILLEVSIPNEDAANHLVNNGFFTAAKESLSEGIIAGLGFSAPFLSAPLKTAAEICEDWAFCSIPLNYLSKGPDALLKELSMRGMAIFACDPFAGGLLAQVPEHVHQLFRDAPVPRRHDEWALRAIWERQEITSIILDPVNPVLFGIRAILAEAGRANSLPSIEQDVLKNAAIEINQTQAKS